MKFTPLGYGAEKEIIDKLKPGVWVVIRDDDAATVGADSCWFAAQFSAQTDQADVEKQYEKDGGTVSFSAIVKKIAKPKQQNIEISEIVFDWYAENFNSARQGIIAATESYHHGIAEHPVTAMFSDPDQAHAFMLAAWKQMWRHSLAGLKGVFTPGELSLIIDIHNGHMITPQLYGSNALAVGISDSIALDGTAEKWEVDPGQIIEKAKGLTPTQALCLEIWATGFWYGSVPEGGRDFEKYRDQLT